ncbi:MAG: type II 3-dehydroquinate dehydratase [Magnetococcales bacterium]|nr:type II 3-dehydroquinate dehydratase [Magnetococcales bacterium]
MARSGAIRQGATRTRCPGAARRPPGGTQVGLLPPADHEQTGTAAGDTDVTEQAARRWRILIVNGPNLNLLGRRETGIYGQRGLAWIESACRERAVALGAELECFQSNHEGALVERIQEAMGQTDLIIINPAAYTHTSVAIRDALLAVGVPVIEVHISNIHKREPFRRHSYVSDIAEGVIAGLGVEGYLLALEGGVRRLDAAERQ